MSSQFDAKDKESWFFGKITRSQATDILLAEDGGVFLVRDSSSIPGQYVLCVKEDKKVSHYIIKKIDGDPMQYNIGDRSFEDIPALLNFYKVHYLDTTPLVRPATGLMKVKAKHDFEGKDPEDLSFKKGEILFIISKDEENWWSAKNSAGKIGTIPVPYVKTLEENEKQAFHSLATVPPEPESSLSTNASSVKKLNSLQPDKEVFARVKQKRCPNAYDATALKLDVGDIIKITKFNVNGQWEGQILYPNGVLSQTGHFPFTHVDIINDPNIK